MISEGQKSKIFLGGHALAQTPLAGALRALYVLEPPFSKF